MSLSTLTYQKTSYNMDYSPYIEAKKHRNNCKNGVKAHRRSSSLPAMKLMGFSSSSRLAAAVYSYRDDEQLDCDWRQDSHHSYPDEHTENESNVVDLSVARELPCFSDNHHNKIEKMEEIVLDCQSIFRDVNKGLDRRTSDDDGASLEDKWTLHESLAWDEEDLVDSSFLCTSPSNVEECRLQIHSSYSSVLEDLDLSACGDGSSDTGRLYWEEELCEGLSISFEI